MDQSPADLTPARFGAALALVLGGLASLSLLALGNLGCTCGDEEEEEEEGGSKKKKGKKGKKDKEEGEEGGEGEGEGGEGEGEGGEGEGGGGGGDEGGGGYENIPHTQTILPGPLERLFNCAGDPQTSPDQATVERCMTEAYGDKPDVVKNDTAGQIILQSAELDPCTFDRTAAPNRSNLDGTRPGLGRVYVVYSGGRLRAASMKMAFPKSNGDCKPDALRDFYAELPNFATHVEGYSYRRGSVGYQFLGHLTGGGLYKVQRDTMVFLFEEDSNKRSPFNLFWDRTQVDWPPAARSESMEMIDWVFTEIANASGCNFEGSMLNLIDHDFAWAKRQCAAFGGAKYWTRWHVAESSANFGEGQIKITGAGEEGRIGEVFVQVADPERRGLKELEAAWGTPLRYAPGAGAWTVGKYTVRARQAGNNFRIAVVPAKYQDDFGFVVPAADFAPLWR